MGPRPMASVNFTAADLNPAALRRVGFGTGKHASRAPTARFTSPRNAQRSHGRVHMEFQVR